jgi:hypothetical protein
MKQKEIKVDIHEELMSGISFDMSIVLKNENGYTPEEVMAAESIVNDPLRALAVSLALGSSVLGVTGLVLLDAKKRLMEITEEVVAMYAIKETIENNKKASEN